MPSGPFDNIEVKGPLHTKRFEFDITLHPPQKELVTKEERIEHLLRESLEADLMVESDRSATILIRPMQPRKGLSIAEIQFAMDVIEGVTGGDVSGSSSIEER